MGYSAACRSDSAASTFDDNVEEQRDTRDGNDVQQHRIMSLQHHAGSQALHGPMYDHAQ